ncbi:MAG: hypothetical protein A2104_01140 [Candidatus Melainabacteria bacterium GWF2_32_7]|nr:MAG: hypothetical protein A2104_01140 [Candidatus Melainabacteria bacterium GWF2_32_7]
MELKGPSEAEVKKFIKFEARMEFITVAGHHFRGTLLWADQSAFHIKLDESEKTITLLKTATVYYAAI